MSQPHSAWTPDGEIPLPKPEGGTPSPKLEGGLPSMVTETAVIDAIRTVFDPEIPVDIYELGLIYTIDIHDDGKVKVEMTLTAPACPSAQELPIQVRDAVMGIEGVTDCEVETVWEPPWDQGRMSEEARLQLNMF